MVPAKREEKARDLFSERKYAEAADEYAQLAKEEPACAKWLTNRAKCLFNLGKLLVAVILCKRSIHVDKAWSRAYEIAAQCLLDGHQSQAAEDLLVEGMQAEPSTVIQKLLDDARAAIRSQPSGPQCNVPPLPRAFKFLPDESGYTQPHPGGRADIKTPDASARRRRLEWGQGLSRDEQVALLDEEERAALLCDKRQRAVDRAEELRKAGRVEEAVAMYEREAEAGCTAAMAALASIYVSGEGVALELTRGIAWARRCIQECPAPEYRVLGLPDPSGPKCQGLLGTAYYNGYGGLDVDLVKAERSWRAAADEGVASSMVALAGLLEEQGRPPEDYAVWYRLAAEHGHPYAMLALSQLLLKGSGCARDSNEGMAWLHMAADAGEVLAVKALADVANHLPGTAGMGMLEAARRHVQAWRAREEGSKEGVQGRTLAMEAGICLDMQRARDAAKSRDELLDELKAAGDAPPSFTDYLGARPMSVELAVKYLDELRGRLGRHCPLTELEREAALLAERAGKMGPSLKSMSSESGAPSMLEAVTPALVSLGTLFAGKGMGDEAHTRFFLPAAKMGDPQACHLAGRYLAKRGASGKDLRMAQRFLSQAAARDVAGAQDELDKLTRRLARGDVGSAEDNDDASGGQECRATSASTAPGTSSMSTANQGTASGSGKSGGSKAAGSTVARGASAECNDVPDGSSKGHRNSGDVNVDQGEESAERGLPPFGKQLAELQDLLKSMQPHVGANSRLIPGGLPVHLPMLEDYVQGHRGSYTGWGMLYSVRHYGGLLLALERADYAPAVTQMCHACLFDEKGPGIPTMIDPRTGQLVPESSFQALFDLVDRVLEKGSPPASSSHNTSGASVHAANRGGGGGQHASGPSSAPSASSLFFEAAVVKLSMAMTAQDGLRFSDRALKAAPPRMVPAMLSRRAIFHSNRRKSLADLEAAAKLLRADGSTSLWPYDPPELAGSSGEMAKFREIMACTLEVNMAHCWHDHPANMVTHLMRFQRGVPEDTDGLPKSYFTLCQALISLGPDRRGAEAVYKHLQSLLDEADRLTPLRVPVLQPFRAEVSPSFRELRETVSMLVQVRRQGGAGMAQSATASRLELMAQGQGRDGSAAGSGVIGAAGQAASTGSGGGGAGAAVKSCWGCQARVASLQRCGGCRLAGYCSRECQKKHWKEGHKEACAKLAS